MSFTDEQKNQLNKLNRLRDGITDNLFHIEQILKIYFPEEFDIAYQHWIPQITTALYEDKRWLPRGEQTMQHSMKRLQEKASNKTDQSIKRFI